MVRLPDSTAPRRGVAIALVATLACVALALTVTRPASAADVRVKHTLFGVHDGRSASYATVHEGSVRLWDVGAQWQQVETHQNGQKYDWTRLDGLVADAQSAHAEVTMVVAGTPQFYSSDPWNVPVRSIPAYKAFVRALMKRYQNFQGRAGSRRTRSGTSPTSAPSGPVRSARWPASPRPCTTSVTSSTRTRW